MLKAIGLISYAAAQDYDYISNGSDWPSIFPDCALSNQSPINLNSKTGSYQQYDQLEDLYTKSYQNQRDETVLWEGKTTEVNLGTGPNLFASNLANSVFGANKQFNGVKFNFHAGSEHTIDNRRHDFEMHTFHEAESTENDIGLAAVGIIFSVDEYTANLSAAEQKIIDTFFETLDLSQQNDPTVSFITFGDLMNMVDTNNRYVYKGSLTTPPCDRFVYWNVLSTIYPISQRHLDLFKSQLTRGENGQLATRGNWRQIQSLDEHNVIRVTDTALGSELQSANSVTYEINVNIFNQGG